MENIKEIEYKGYIIKISHDEDIIESPREWDNLGTMVCFHKNYDLGDKHGFNKDDFDSWEDLKDYIEKELDTVMVLPLYIYDHSGLSISTTPFSCPWDSGKVGFMYVSKDKVRKNYDVKRISKDLKEKVKKVLISEVDTYSQYINGEVYSYIVKDKNSEIIDSCCGFYDIEHLIEEAKHYIDYTVNKNEVAEKVSRNNLRFISV